MLEMIENYAKETNQEIHGYYTDLMTKSDGVSSQAGASNFHAEVALFDQNVFSKPKRIDHLTNAEVTELNALANLNAARRKLAQEKKRSAMEISRSSHEQGRADTSQLTGNLKARRLTF